ncbi:protein starmaker [Hordeum vulgare]|nr:protein starmaker [Hordeum vulgare]
MYNGIGLQTARGSGTNGYVQTNKFFIRPRTDGAAKAPLHNYDHDPGRDKPGGLRPPNKEILEHDRRRQVELRLVELRDTLEEQGYTEGEIEERVEEARKEAAAAAVAAEAGGRAGGGGPAPRPGEGFTGTQSHHVAARKEKQLETLRAALGLEAEIEQKKAEVDSDPESGELVPGKDSEGMDIDVQNDRKAKKHAKKGKKEKGNDRNSHSRSSRKSKHGYDSEDDSESDHDERKGNKYIKRSFLDRVPDSEILHKNAKQGKGARHDSESDSDSDHGKKKAKHTKNNRDEGKNGPVKSSRHDSKDEKPRRSKYKGDSYSESESDVSDSDSGSDFDRKQKKGELLGSKNDKQAPKSKEKEASLGKNVDKRKRHDSDSNGSAHDRKIHLDAAIVRKDHSRDKPKIDPRSDEYKNKRPLKTSRHDSEDEKPHSKVLRKEKYTGEPEIDSERYTSEKNKPAKSSIHVPKADKEAPNIKRRKGRPVVKMLISARGMILILILTQIRMDGQDALTQR